MAGIPDNVFENIQKKQIQKKESSYIEDVKGITEPVFNAYVFVKNLVTGGNKKYFEDVDEIYSNPMISSGNPVADINMRINRTVTPNISQNIESYISNGASIAKDKNDNIMVFFPNGEYGYHNEPGMSKVDIDQFMATGVGFGAATKANQFLNSFAKIPLTSQQFFRNAITNMAAATTFTIGQDAVANLTGTKSGLSGQNFAFNVVGGLLAPALGLLPAKGLKSMSSGSRQIINSIAPKFLNREGQYSQEAIKELESLGITGDRLNEYSKEDLNVFAQALELGYEKDIAKSYMNSSKFGIDLFDAQINRDQDALQKLNEGMKGAYGSGVQADLLKIIQSQNSQLSKAAIEMAGLPEDFDFNDATNAQKNRLGLTIKSFVEDAFEAKNKYVDDKYELISGNLTILPEDATTLKGNLQSILKQNYTDANDPFFAKDYEKSSSIYNRINNFKKQIDAQKGQDFTLAMKDFQKFRSNITKDVFESTGSDSVLANELLGEFDKFQDDMFQNALKFTDRMTETQLSNFKQANDAYRELNQQFLEQKTTSLGKKDQVGNFIQRVLNGKETPVDILKTVNGLKDVKNTSLALKKIEALYSTLDALPEAERVIATQQLSETLKESFHLNLVDTSLKKSQGSFVMNPITYHRQVQQYLADDNLRGMMGKFMSQDEINSLNEFSQLVKETTPGDFNNASNTAATLAKIYEKDGILDGLSRNLGKLYAYNTGGLKGLFTFRTISSLKGIPSKELNELNIAKTLEQVQGEIPDDVSTAMGFALSTKGLQESIGSVKINKIEDILNYELPILGTTEDIKNYRSKVVGLENMNDEQKTQIKKEIENREKIKRILR